MLRQTVPNVDYSDPTMAPTNDEMAMNEEAGRGNIYDGPVLIDTTQPNNETTTGVLQQLRQSGWTKCSLDHEFFGSEDQ